MIGEEHESYVMFFLSQNFLINVKRIDLSAKNIMLLSYNLVMCLSTVFSRESPMAINVSFL